MSVSAEWILLGKGRKGRPVYYRLKELYEMQWGDANNIDNGPGIPIHLSDYMVAAAPFGGPIALTRNPRRAMRLASGEAGKPYIYVYTCSGKLISKFLWNREKKGNLMEMGWNNQEQLVVLTDNGYVFVYDLFGKPLRPFSFTSEVTQQGIAKAVIWPSGIAVLTKSLEVWIVRDLDDPRIERLSPLGLSGLAVNPDELEEEAAMEVVPPELSADGTVDVILSLPGQKEVFITNSMACQRLPLSNTPFKRIAVSPLGNAFATFTEQGGLWVVKSDFTDNHPEFMTKSKSQPAQLCWCGEESVCLQWSPEQLNRGDLSLLLMIGPNGDYYKRTFDGPIHLVTEQDGIRIITNTTCEFLQRVPAPTLEIFRIGSLEPAAMLYDAYKEFEKRNASSIKNIRSIKNKPKAVMTCLRAACHEFDPDLQRKLLRAASYGKSFCENFKHQEFIATCKKLRVLNALRDPDVGMPLTSDQYDVLTPEVIIDRLVNRFHHLLAFKICEYLEMKPENVLVHWACAKVKAYAQECEAGSATQSEKEVIESIRQKLSKSEGASYAIVASTAYRAGRKDLATALLEFEKNAGEQVPLLLDMKEIKRALRKAIESGETDLVYLVLLHMKKKMQPQQLFTIINESGFEIAKNLLITYCKEQDIAFLSTFFQALELPHEAAGMKVLESFQSDDFTAKKKLLMQARDLYAKNNKVYAVESKCAADNIDLLDTQMELDDKKEFSVHFTGLSMAETIFYLIIHGQDALASKLKTSLKVSDKIYWRMKVKALAQSGRWDELEKFSKKSSKSPIGFRPFVDACLEHDKLQVQAAKYIPKLTDSWEKVECFVLTSKFKEAIETCMLEKDQQQAVQMLAFIKTKTTNAQTR